MLEYRVIDLASYPRREHLSYFMCMQHPQFNLTAEVDVTDLKEFCGREGCSFFLAFLHAVALAADSVPQLRQRIIRTAPYDPADFPPADPLSGFEIREYAQCPTSHTETAGEDLYCYCPLYHHMPWKEYIMTATELQRKAREKGTLEEDPEIEGFTFATCIPWVRYTEIVHPMTDRFDSNPRFSWGRFAPDFRGRLMMPLTVAAHHGLVDGIHVGRFYEAVERNMALLAEGKLL